MLKTPLARVKEDSNRKTTARAGKAPPNSKPQFSQIRTRRVFEEICEQVRREMSTGALRPGDKLPTERDLAVKFDVSRTAVREALRSLEIAGVVGLQKGAKGGAFILTGDPDLITRSMRDLFYLGRISLDGLTEARTMIMQMAVALACERMSPDILAALKENYEHLVRLPTSGPASHRIAISAEFYNLLAQATQNEVLQVIIASLTDIVLQQVEKSKTDTLPDLITHRRRLLQFLAKKDASAASREIAAHLQRLHKHLAAEQRPNQKRRVSGSAA